MKRSIFSLISIASLVSLTTIGFSTPEAALAQQQSQMMQRTAPQEIQLAPTHRRPTNRPNAAPNRPAQYQAPGTTSAVECGPTTCTCEGIDDCDALFTSTLCAPGTETTTDDDHGQCTKND